MAFDEAKAREVVSIMRNMGELEKQLKWTNRNYLEIAKEMALERINNDEDEFDEAMKRRQGHIDDRFNEIKEVLMPFDGADIEIEKERKKLRIYEKGEQEQ